MILCKNVTMSYAGGRKRRKSANVLCGVLKNGTFSGCPSAPLQGWCSQKNLKRRFAQVVFHAHASLLHSENRSANRR